MKSDGFRTKKSLGQHFLNSDKIPELLTEAGQVTAKDTVVEIGPGTGALTKTLLQTGARVIAFEADKRAVEVLKERFAERILEGKLSVIHADVRELDIGGAGLSDQSFKVISNIPYYLTGQLFRRFLSGTVQPSKLVFLVQKEVAKRATADIEKGGKESLLSLSIKAFGEPKYVASVGRGHFTPPPKVDSAIVLVENINRDRFKNVSPGHFFELLHLGFGARRKQLLGALARKYDRAYLSEIFSSLGLPLDVRAEDINVDIWLRLSEKLES